MRITIKLKILLLAIGIALLSTVLMSISVIWMNHQQFQKALNKQFTLAGNLGELSLKQFASDAQVGMGAFQKYESRKIAVDFS